MRSFALTIEEMCRRLRPHLGEQINKLYLKYTLAETRQQKFEVEQAVGALYQKYVSHNLLTEQLLLDPPQEEIIKGKYPLGTIMYGEKELYPFGLREKDWMRHVCVSGMSGSGKTNFAFQILGSFIFNKKPFLVFDWKKSFRPLTKIEEKLRIFTIGNDSIANFKLNINKPPKGVPPKEWINMLADIITEAFSGSFGVHKLLVETLDKAYKDFGIYAGSENYPTWYQIRDRLEARAHEQTRKSRESEWLESALRVAYSLTFGNFGKAICYKGEEESNITELFNHQTIMELASLSNTEKKFFTQFLLTYIYKYAKAGNVNVTEEFKFGVLVDEAHNIFLKDKPNFISESISDVIFREIREYGVSLITLDQHISKLSDVVSGNSATNIAFQQMLPNDIEAISRLMQIPDQKDFFTKLPVGYGIVRLVERHHNPFIIKAPLVKLKNANVDDADLKERMKMLQKNTKRKKFFHQSCKDEELAKKIKGIGNVMKSQGIAPDEESIKSQLEKNEKENGKLIAQLKVEGKQRPKSLAEAVRSALIQKQQEFSEEHGHDDDKEIEVLREEKEVLALEKELTIKADVAQTAQEEYNKKQKDGPAGFGLRNHKQQKIFDMAKKRMLNGESIKDLKAWFIKDGEDRSDVAHAFRYIERKGFVEKWTGKAVEMSNEPLVLNDEQKAFLISAVNNPNKPVTSVYKEAGLSPRKGNKLKNELEDLDIIEIQEVRTEKGWTKHIHVLYSEKVSKLLDTLQKKE